MPPLPMYTVYRIFLFFLESLLPEGAGGSFKTPPTTVSETDLGREASEVVKKYLPLLFKEIASLKEIHQAEMDKLTTRIHEFEEWKKQQERELEEWKKQKELEFDSFKRNLDGIIAEKNKEIKELKENCNDRERHSRSWNVRLVTSVPEKQFEDPEKIARELLESVPEIEERRLDIDIAHRVGKYGTDRPRTILVRLTHKSDTRFLLTRAIRDKLRAKRIALYPDLTRDDQIKKSKYAKEISVLVARGHRARFENGNWIIDSQIFRLENYVHELGQ